MNYEGLIYRPPSEAQSLIIQATVGCSHNSCTFCSMYKAKQFRIRSIDAISRDLAEASLLWPQVRRIFLADGDALILPVSELTAILNKIHVLFPDCQRVSAYASPRSILQKSASDLVQLKNAGLSMAYMGLESGNDEILSKVHKGASAAEIISAGLKVKKAGIMLSVTAISGLGGKALWREHAIDTGKAFTKMKPDYIGLLTLMVENGTSLAADIVSGKFALLSPDEISRETLVMLEHMDCEGSIFRSNHASNYISLRGTLNNDRTAMIKTLHRVLEGNAPYKPENLRML